VLSYRRAHPNKNSRYYHPTDNPGLLNQSPLGYWELRLSTTFPVSRFSAAMHNRQNENVVLLDCIENCIGKSACHASSDSIIIDILAAVKRTAIPHHAYSFKAEFEVFSERNPLLSVVKVQFLAWLSLFPF